MLLISVSREADSESFSLWNEMKCFFDHVTPFRSLVQFAMGPENSIDSAFSSVDLKGDESDKKGGSITAMTMDGGTNGYLRVLVLLLQLLGLI